MNTDSCSPILIQFVNSWCQKRDGYKKENSVSTKQTTEENSSLTPSKKPSSITDKTLHRERTECPFRFKFTVFSGPYELSAAFHKHICMPIWIIKTYKKLKKNMMLLKLQNWHQTSLIEYEVNSSNFYQKEINVLFCSIQH